MRAFALALQDARRRAERQNQHSRLVGCRQLRRNENHFGQHFGGGRGDSRGALAGNPPARTRGAQQAARSGARPARRSPLDAHNPQRGFGNSAAGNVAREKGRARDDVRQTHMLPWSRRARARPAPFQKRNRRVQAFDAPQRRHAKRDGGALERPFGQGGVRADGAVFARLGGIDDGLHDEPHAQRNPRYAFGRKRNRLAPAQQ